jgi:hypothetical protein
MPWGAALAVGGSLIAGSMQADAAGDAADAQSRSADKADATQRYQYDTTRADNAPFRESGVAANNQLSYRLGLSPTPASTQNALTRDQLRGELLPQFTSRQMSERRYTDPEIWSMGDSVGNEIYHTMKREEANVVDEGGLNTAIQARLAQQEQGAAAARTTAQNDPNFGSLLRNFTMADRDADPVYQSGLQFGLDEGTKGINRMAAASGSSLSGATLKALTRFGNDYGSTKANESYNRFNTNQNSLYNKLAGVSGAGQQATNQVSAAGQNMANNVSNNALYSGSVRGASAIAQGNALTGAMNNIYGVGKKKGWWDTAPGSGGGLSDFTPQYAGTGNPFNWTNGDS